MHFFTVIIARRCFNLRFNLANPCFNCFGIAFSVDDGCVVFVNGNFFAITQLLQTSIFQFVTLLFADNCSARQNRDVFQHCLATVAKTGCFYRHHFQARAQTIDNQNAQSLRVNIFRNDEQRTTRTKRFFQNWQHFLHVANLFVVYQNEWILVFSHHRISVRDEIRRQITTVELHTDNFIHVSIRSFCFFNCDNAIGRNPLHGVGNQRTNFVVVVSRNSRNLLDFRKIVVDCFALFLQINDNLLHRFFHSPLQIHWICASRHVFQAFTNHCLRQNGCRCCAVTRCISRF